MQRDYTKGFNKVRTSQHISRLFAADENRDNRLIGLRTFVLAQTYSWITEIKTASDQMMAVLNTHGTNIESMANNEESGKIHKLLDNLSKPVYSDSIEIMGTRPWIVALAAAQTEFESIDAERTTEQADTKDIASATKQRKELQVALKNFIMYVEVMAGINTDQVWRNLLAQIGQRVAAAGASYRPAHCEKKEKPD